MIYICCAYLAIINIVTFIVYAREAKPSRIPFVFVFGLPIIGGSFGAILANYCFETEHRELRAVYSKFIAFIPPILFFVQIAAMTAMLGPKLVFGTVWNGVVTQGGVIGAVLLVVNVISFVLVAIRKASYYFAPIGHDVIPDAVLIPFILVGTIGAVLSKIIFNFKEDWSTSARKGVQNFLYNNGMFAVLVAYIALLAWFFCFR
ncbi:hypothetical protein [uncultured Bifidobacterium sp.]|uniref:hypothetical protein n=1 Tax=uncultured Bifidobacterium sp. TaxID=165187 RepID=UPI0027DB451C|nr:hypothetical protein [uncultured Bifidobacterium sp.]